MCVVSFLRLSNSLFHQQGELTTVVAPFIAHLLAQRRARSKEKRTCSISKKIPPHLFFIIAQLIINSYRKPETKTHSIHSPLSIYCHSLSSTTSTTITMNLINICDLIITVAYFSIPLQILVSLWKSPANRKIPMKLVVTLVLFAAFIFLCGTGHLMRYFDMGHSAAFVYVNVATALVSFITAIYLVPLIPCMFSLLDESLNRLTNESKESKSKLFTFMAFLCHEIR